MLLSPIYSPPNLSTAPCLDTAPWPQQEAKKKPVAKLPNLWSLTFRWEDTWIQTSKEVSHEWRTPSCVCGARPHTVIQAGAMPPQHVTSREKCFVNSAAAVTHAAMSLQHLTRQHSFTSPLTLLKLKDTQFWLLAYNVKPHMALEVFLLPWAISSIKNPHHQIPWQVQQSHPRALGRTPPHPSSHPWAAMPTYTGPNLPLGRNSLPLCKWSLLPYRQHRLMLQFQSL